MDVFCLIWKTLEGCNIKILICIVNDLENSKLILFKIWLKEYFSPF